MAENETVRPEEEFEVARRRTIWDRGPFGLIPNRYLRRSAKGVAAAATVPSLFWRTRNGPITDLRLPDFLGIGVARAGTTWLHYNLDAHPEIFMPVRKEQMFWDNNLSKGINSYAKSFRGSEGLIAGEVTPRYGVMDPWRIRLMARAMPDVRLLYLIRNPIERSWSHLNFKAHKENRTLADLSRDEIFEYLTSERFDRNAAYSLTYRYYCEQFSKEQLWVGFYDDISLRPKELLTEIFEHIGASTNVDWDEFPFARRFNAGKGYENQTSTSTTIPDDIKAFLAKRYSRELRVAAMTFRGHAERWVEEARDLLD